MELNLYPTDIEAANVEGREGQTHPDPNINLLPVVDSHDGSSGYYDIQTNATNSVQIDFDTLHLMRLFKITQM